MGVFYRKKLLKKKYWDDFPFVFSKTVQIFWTVEKKIHINVISKSQVMKHFIKIRNKSAHPIHQFTLFSIINHTIKLPLAHCTSKHTFSYLQLWTECMGYLHSTAISIVNMFGRTQIFDVISLNFLIYSQITIDWTMPFNRLKRGVSIANLMPPTRKFSTGRSNSKNTGKLFRFYAWQTH